MQFPLPASSGSIRVLLADHKSEEHHDLPAMLSQCGYELETIGNGDGAAIFREGERFPDIIIIDSIMPAGDDFSLLRAMREDKRLRAIPVLVVDSDAGEEARRQALQAGADDYISRPINPHDLIMRIDAHVRLGRFRREAEAMLQESEAKFAAAFDYSPLALTITSLEDGRLVDVNERFLQVTGYSRYEAIGRTPEQLGLWVAPERRAERFARLKSGQPVPNIEARFRIKNGQELTGVIGSAVIQMNGRPSVLSSVTDITAQKRAEQALRENEERLRLALSAAKLGDWQLHLSGMRLTCSYQFKSNFGRSPEDVFDYDAFQASIHPEDRERVLASIQHAIEHAGYYEADYRCIWPDNSIHWINARGRAIAESEEPPTRVVGVTLDITERKRAEEALRESERSLSTLISNIPGFVFRCMNDTAWTIVFISEGVKEMTGFSAADFLSRTVTWEGLIHPSDVPYVRKNAAGRIQAKSAIQITYRIINACGEERWVWDRSFPMFSETGEIDYWEGFVIDITEQKQAEKAADKAAKRQRILSEALAELLSSDDPHKLVRELFPKVAEHVNADTYFNFLINDRGDGLYLHACGGIPQETVRQVGQLEFGQAICGTVAQIRSPIIATDIQNSGYDKAALVRGFGIQSYACHPLMSRDRLLGTLSFASHTRTRFEENEIEFMRLICSYVALAMDRALSAQNLRQNEERYRSLTRVLTSFVWQTDAKGAFVTEQSEWASYTGQNREEYSGWGWLHALHPDDRSSVNDAWRGALETRTQYEWRGRIWNAASGEYRYYESRAVPLFAIDGSIREWIGTVTDIHEQRKAEEALREAERRKDEFLATLAHELRNPLTPVRNAVQIVQMKGPQTQELKWAMEVINQQMKHMTRLIDDLLDVSRISRNKLELRKSEVQLADVVQGAVESSRPFIEQCAHTLTVTYPPEPTVLNADLTRLTQVFVNLLDNAAKYTNPGGQIRLSAERKDDQIIVSVSDTGIGIPGDKQGTIFDMFSQVENSLTRTQGGLGIGLHLTRRLVEMHGGRIEVRSDGYGKGSEFLVYLPVVQRAQFNPDAGGDIPAKPAQLSHLRVLVVDDTRITAASFAMLLEMMGNTVCLAHDGEEAVQRAFEFRPDVVLLDIGLPKLNGYDAAGRIRQQEWGKDMVLIAVTGWGQEDDKRRAKEAGFDHHMVKPLDPENLMSILATLPQRKQ